jgi:amino acid transporter
MASGYIGGIGYLKYAFPNWQPVFDRWGAPWGWNAIAAGGCALVADLLSRKIRTVGWLGVALNAGALLTVLIVIVVGLTHLHPALLKPPPGAFTLNLQYLPPGR